MIKHHQRILGVYTLILLLFTATICRVYMVATSDTLVAAAGAQSTYRMEVVKTRGVIYDRNFMKLVNREHRYLASVLPTPQAAAALLAGMEGEERETLARRLQGGAPFVLGLSHSGVYATGVDVFKVPVRYSEPHIAPHVVGYLSGDGARGVAGIEKSYDQFLAEMGTEISMRYRVDAAGRVMAGGGFGVERIGGAEEAGGVVLTIDSRIQALAERALAKLCEKGAAVVIDAVSGEILAMVSLPVFDPSDIAASFDSPDAPFVNRAISGYSIGSAFKAVVCAAALEAGISENYSYECTGVEVADGVTFRCNNHAVHGFIDMARAMRVSCNTYFINLTQQIPPAFLLSVARNLGFGSSSELADGFITSPGNLPTPGEMSSAAAYATISFGQGSSLASPLQMAVAMAQIANTGLSVTPRLISGFTLDGETLVDKPPLYSRNHVISERTSAKVREILVSVIEEGSGRQANPGEEGAGGKTSSAQTGQIVDGKEIVHAWFAGFYPAAQPRYAIAVIVEGGESGERVAAPIFREIAEGIGRIRG